MSASIILLNHRADKVVPKTIPMARGDESAADAGVEIGRDAEDTTSGGMSSRSMPSSDMVRRETNDVAMQERF